MGGVERRLQLKDVELRLKDVEAVERRQQSITSAAL